MARNCDKQELLSRFVAQIKAELRASRAKGAKVPVIRRKLSTISSRCGRKKATASFLESARSQLRQSGVFTRPSLTDPGLRSTDWVRFSLSPFPPEPHLFAKEKNLRAFVVASLGQGVFRGLVPFKTAGNSTGIEYQLPDNRRIDLLCRERTKSGHGALVAIELKRGTSKGAIEQLMGYIDALQELFPRRDVKGIIISSHVDPAAAALLKSVKSHQIKWYCYKVEFEQLWTTPNPLGDNLSVASLRWRDHDQP